MSNPIPVLVGTESGNAEYYAEQLVKAIIDAGTAARTIDMGDFEPDHIARLRTVLIVTSTYGNGGPPGNAEQLLHYLETSEVDLTCVEFAVCGLGSTMFDNFAQCGKDFEAALLARGATRAVDRADCDEGDDDAFEQFKDDVLAYLQSAAKRVHEASAKVAAQQTPSRPVTDPPALAEGNAPRASGRRTLVPVVAKRLLSAPGSNKETMHYELDLTGTTLSYEVGDSFALHPDNMSEEIVEVIQAAGLTGAEVVQRDGGPTTLEQALRRCCLLTVGRPLLEALAETGGAAKDVLQAGPEQASQYLQQRHVIDVLREHRQASLDAQTLVSLLRKIGPRLFSVASSPTRDPNRVAFTVETVRYEWNDRPVRGVATCWLADRVQVGDQVPVHVVPNPAFRLPRDGRPVIMVGPGTGIAPFMAHLAEMEASAINGETWLFFGHQRESKDFLYRREILGWRDSGVLTRSDFAWSRDQNHKVYVQHKLADRGREVWRWLERGAEIYVCGDAERMEPAVRRAFEELAATRGRVDGRAWLDQAKAEGRYRTDVY